MAKLSAYGQKEVSRWVRESTREPRYKGGPTWERTTYSFQDNGRLLCKRDVRWPHRCPHCYGWKVVHPAGWGTPEMLAKVYARLEKAEFVRQMT